jgi:hypothetical protein
LRENFSSLLFNKERYLFLGWISISPHFNLSGALRAPAILYAEAGLRTWGGELVWFGLSDFCRL